MSCLGFPTGTAASHPERPAGGALRHSERPAFNGSPISDFERIIDLAARQARPQLTVDIYIYISQTLHGTAIYAAPLTPKTTPTDRHIWHTWSVWVCIYIYNLRPLAPDRRFGPLGSQDRACHKSQHGSNHKPLEGQFFSLRTVLVHQSLACWASIFHDDPFLWSCLLRLTM